VIVTGIQQRRVCGAQGSPRPAKGSLVAQTRGGWIPAHGRDDGEQVCGRTVRDLLPDIAAASVVSLRRPMLVRY
jgi:hypothetical protein